MNGSPLKAEAFDEVSIGSRANGSNAPDASATTTGEGTIFVGGDQDATVGVRVCSVSFVIVSPPFGTPNGVPNGANDTSDVSLGGSNASPPPNPDANPSPNANGDTDESGRDARKGDDASPNAANEGATSESRDSRGGIASGAVPKPGAPGGAPNGSALGSGSASVPKDAPQGTPWPPPGLGPNPDGEDDSAAKGSPFPLSPGAKLPLG